MLAVFLSAFPSFAQNKQWKAGPPAFKVKDDKFAPSVEFKDSKVTLKNRGIIVSRKEFDKVVTVSFTWKWTGGKAEGKYEDVLAVAFATDGKQRAWASEIEDGLVVRFAAHAEEISVERYSRDKPSPVILAAVPAKFEKDKAHFIKVTLGDGVVSVHRDKGWVLRARVPEIPSGRFVAIYNREPVSGVIQQSVLDDLQLDQ